MAFQVHHVLPHEVVDLFRMRLAEIFPSGEGFHANAGSNLVALSDNAGGST